MIPSMQLSVYMLGALKRTFSIGFLLYLEYKRLHTQLLSEAGRVHLTLEHQAAAKVVAFERSGSSGEVLPAIWGSPCRLRW